MMEDNRNVPKADNLETPKPEMGKFVLPDGR
jgi:hypothetical protein